MIQKSALLKMGRACFRFPSFDFRAKFKFFREMDEIFKKELRVDDSAAETSFGVEDDDCASELSQVKGEAKRKTNCALNLLEDFWLSL